MISIEHFEQGLRLDQYMASLERNKENFRANFVKAIEFFTPEDLVFFRKLPQKVNVLVLTDDDNPDALRDVPIIGRLSVEVGTVKLKLFRRTHSPEVVHALAQNGYDTLPVFAFFDATMKPKGVLTQRLPDLTAEMGRRHSDWIKAHVDIRDAGDPIEKMSPITRTRLLQTVYALSPDQRVYWGRKTVQTWRSLLSAP